MCVYLDFLDQFRQLLDNDRIVEAIQLADSMANQHPRSLAIQEHLALALWCHGNFMKALEVLISAESLGKLSPYAQLIYVHCLALRGSRRDALRRLKSFLTVTVLEEADLSTVARKFGEFSEWRLALEVCLHIARSNPKSAGAWYGIAYYQEKLGLPPQATNEAFRNAFLLSECLCTRLRFAKNLAELGRIEEAYMLIRSMDFRLISKPWQREAVAKILGTVGDTDMLNLLLLFDNDQQSKKEIENRHPNSQTTDTPQAPKSKGEE